MALSQWTVAIVVVNGGSAQLHTFAEFNRTDGPSDAIAHGMLVTTDGYGFAGGTPGNVVLAFTVDGKKMTGTIYSVNKETRMYTIYAPGSTFAQGLYTVAENQMELLN